MISLSPEILLTLWTPQILSPAQLCPETSDFHIKLPTQASKRHLKLNTPPKCISKFLPSYLFLFVFPISPNCIFQVLEKTKQKQTNKQTNNLRNQ